MSIRDFVKKHKKKLIAASGILASLLAMTQLAGNMNVLNLPEDFDYAVEPTYDPYGFYDPHMSHFDRIRRAVQPSIKRPRGNGKSNSLLKAVQAYRKKHGCSFYQGQEQC